MNSWLSRTWHKLFGGGPVPVTPELSGPLDVPVLTRPAMIPDGKPPRRSPADCIRVRDHYTALMDAYDLRAEVRASASTLRMVRDLGSASLIRRARDNHRRIVGLYRAARARITLTYTPFRNN